MAQKAARLRPCSPCPAPPKQATTSPRSRWAKRATGQQAGSTNPSATPAGVNYEGGGWFRRDETKVLPGQNRPGTTRQDRPQPQSRRKRREPMLPRSTSRYAVQQLCVQRLRVKRLCVFGNSFLQFLQNGGVLLAGGSCRRSPNKRTCLYPK